MDAKFEQFLRERRYLQNLSEASLSHYRQAFDRLIISSPTQTDLDAFVIRQRELGLRATSVNSFARALNAYLRWSGSPLKIAKLKEPQRNPQLFTLANIQTITKWHPEARSQQRSKLLVLMLADTGCRISEVLNLKWTSVDLDNLLITVVGKGDKMRIIPFSMELRRYLFKWRQQSNYDLVFCTRHGLRLTIRNCHHEVHRMLARLNIDAPERLLHSLRHLFATEFIRRGGNVLHLQRILGHTTLEMCRRYVQVQTADLSAAHHSMLSR